MKRYFSGITISAGIWIRASMVFGLYWLIGTLLIGRGEYFWTALPAFVAAALGSLPILFVMTLSLYVLNITQIKQAAKISLVYMGMFSFHFAICFGLLSDQL